MATPTELTQCKLNDPGVVLAWDDSGVSPMSA